MPIRDSDPDDCAQKFRKHLSKLIKQTVPGSIPVLAFRKGQQFWVSFWRGEGPVSVSVDTRFGLLIFHMTQTVEPVWNDLFQKYQLQTNAYSYRLEHPGAATNDAFFRWEYKRKPASVPGPPRHHMHALATTPCDGRALDLDKLHLPTGWVLIEDVIRFLITELGMKPPCGDNWAKMLAESEEVFHTQFSGKRCVSADCPYRKR